MTPPTSSSPPVPHSMAFHLWDRGWGRRKGRKEGAKEKLNQRRKVGKGTEWGREQKGRKRKENERAEGERDQRAKKGRQEKQEGDGKKEKKQRRKERDKGKEWGREGEGNPEIQQHARGWDTYRKYLPLNSRDLAADVKYLKDGRNQSQNKAPCLRELPRESPNAAAAVCPQTA